MEMKFYRCKHCGQIVAIVKKTGAPLICCGEEMEEIIPCTVDASHEKHIPVYKVEGDLVTVNVGSVEHPMIDAHYIEWVAIQTTSGNQRKLLKPNDKPTVEFKILDTDKVIAVYAYCNLHGLWKA
ncbi:MAG: desulfoferrodoxin FeS4 iron-binding domain-containing protein [Acholeplasmatales bacterium]|nr:desulfoferrodoxin FeS4 iron-binding domain-containing protein [Acholeplasmatales bacterium]